MKRKTIAQKFLTFALTASVTATMFPTSAFAVTGRPRWRLTKGRIAARLM